MYLCSAFYLPKIRINVKDDQSVLMHRHKCIVSVHIKQYTLTVPMVIFVVNQ